MKKQFMMYVLAAVAVCFLSLANAVAAEYHVDTSTAFNNAVYISTTGDIVELTADVTMSADITDIIGKNITLTSDGMAMQILCGTGTYSGFNIANSTVTMENLSFQNFTSTSNGAGIYNHAGSNVITDSVTFLNNAAVNGGAIYSNGVLLDITEGVFDSNTATSGGAVFVNGGSALIDSSEFTGNSATSNGGALYNNATTNVTNTSFTTNEANRGGAIFNNRNITAVSSDFTENESLTSGGAVYNNSNFNGSDVSFTSNTAATSGGAIYSAAASSVNLSGNSLFEGNAAGVSGGAIYGESNTAIRGNTKFINNTAAVEGGAIYNKGVLSLDSGSGDIEFTGNTAGGISNDIYNASESIVYVNGDSNKVIFNGGISGEQNSTFYKSGTGIMEINGDSSDYNGDFYLEGGNVVVSDDFFTGYNEITEGTLNIVQGGNISAGIISVSSAGIVNIDTTDNIIFTGSIVGANNGLPDNGGTFNKNVSSTGDLMLLGANLSKKIDVYGGSVTASTGTVFRYGSQIALHNGRDFYITTPNSLNLYSNGLTGDASTYALKTGTGELFIIGNNSSFKGTYEQKAGTTTVTSARGQRGAMFTGINNIYDSVLNVTKSNFTRASVALGHNVNLFNNARQNYWNTTAAQTIINTANVSFNGDNSTAYFAKDGESVREAEFLLQGKFSNTGTGNKVVFDNSIVAFGSTDYKNQEYNFINSIFDLYGTGTKNVEFNDLSITGTNGVKVGIDFTGSGPHTLVTDTLTTNLASGNLYLYDTRLYSGADSSVAAGTYYSTVLYGGLTFDAVNSRTFSTIKKQKSFDVYVDTNNIAGIAVDVITGYNSHSLYTRNAEDKTRSFSLGEAMTYYIDQSLSNTQDGYFVVGGGDDSGDKSADKYIISGRLDTNNDGIADGAARGYFFNLAEDTKMKIYDITVEEAYIAGSGSVLSMSSNTAAAIFSNVILADNEATVNGGAVYATAGELFIDSVTARGNRAFDGGFLYVSADAATKFDNSVNFTQNRASNSGGAIFADNSRDLHFENAAISFTNNFAANKGGAINTEGSNLMFIDNNAVFTGNASKYGGAIAAEAATVNFDGGNINFSNNNATEYGGALYFGSGNSTLAFHNNTTRFNNNISGISGGAIAVVGSTLTMTVNRSSVSFSGNTGAAGQNDLYMSGSRLNINTVNFHLITDRIYRDEVAFNGGIYVETAQNTINKTGYGILSLSGNNYIQGEFDMSAGLLKILNADYMHENGSFKMANSRGMIIDNSEMEFGETVSSVVISGNSYDEDRSRHDNSWNGAILVTGGSTVTFNSAQTDFVNNKAFDFGGGAIQNNASIVNFGGTGHAVNFINNSVVYSTYFANDFGGAVYNKNAEMNFSDNIVKFSTNTAIYGGAVVNDNSSLNFTDGSVTFSHNEANGSGYGNSGAFIAGGGAIYNENDSTVSFNSLAVSFENNKAVKGGAIVNSANSAVNAVNADITFLANAATSDGGAIYNDNASTLSLSGKAEFLNNSATRYGGAIYNSSTTSLTAYNADILFSGNTAQQGGAIYNTGILNLITNGGNLMFSNSGTAAGQNDIRNNAGTININGNDGDVIVRSAVRGNGTIRKSGDGRFLIDGNSSGYSGRFEQSAGTTLVTNNYFVGISSITGGILEFSTGTVLSTGTIGIYGAGDMEITTPGNLSFSGNVIGDGIINKTSTGTLTLTGNNGNFTGIYTQTDGTTTVNVNGTMFTGVNNIVDSILNVTHNGAAMGYNVNLGNNGISNYYKADPSLDMVISASNINFTGDNALAYFTSNSAAQARYILGGAFSDAGTGNEVLFDNSYVTFADNDFISDTLYSFNNSVVDISNNALTGPGSTRTVEFGNLSTSGSRLDFGVIFDGATVENDMLKTASSAGSFDLGLLTIKHDNDAGLLQDYRLHVLDGIEFNADGVSNIATLVYEYTAEVDNSDKEYVTLKAIAAASENSLDIMNMKNDVRAFLFSYGETYQEGNSLHNMSSGTFYVKGYDAAAENSLLSGLLANSTNTTTGRGSFFNIESGTDVKFYLTDLRISSAQANGEISSDPSIGRTDMDGSVLRLMSDLADVKISNVIFDENEAFGNGGAIYAGAGALYISNSVFANNVAGGNGGAMYIAGSTVTLNTDRGGILFTNNTADGISNDIYLDSDALLNISGAGNTILESGFLSNNAASGIEVYKTGTGTLFLGGDNEVYGRFTVDNGMVAFNNAAAYKGKELIITGNSSLNLQNKAVNNIELESFETDSRLMMDVFADGSNDKIITGDADVNGNITVMLASGTYYNQSYDLIVATNNLSGTFSNSILLGEYIDMYRFFYNNNIVSLVINGVNISTFSKMSGLTFNQKETAKALDKMSPKPSIPWMHFIDRMVWDLTEAEQREILSRLSGYFLSNVIRNAAADSPADEIYDKVRNHIEKDVTNNGLWVQVKGGQEVFKKDENSLEDYKDLSYGVMAGFDRYVDDKNIMYGVYLRANHDNITQEDNKATGQKGGLGFYGGYIKDGWELKVMALGSYDKFETERAVLGKTAKADFNTITVSGDIEAALKFAVTENVKFRPFTGVEAQNTSYDAFKEEGADMYNLDVRSGNYLRTAARIGAGLEYEKGIWSLYADIEGKYLATGTKPEIESVFEDTDVVFKSRGSTEGNVEAGIGAGAEARIAQNWKLFANAKFLVAERYENIAGNIGIRYVFGKKNTRIDKDIAQAREYARKAEEESFAVQVMSSRNASAEEKAERAVEGFYNIDAALKAVENIEKNLQNDTTMSESEKKQKAQELEEISNQALEARARLVESMYGIKELEEAKIRVVQAEKNIHEALGSENNDKMVEKANLAIKEADEALDKTRIAKNNIEEADEALKKLDIAKKKLSNASGILSEDEIRSLEKDIEDTEMRALAVKREAEKLIKQAETVEIMQNKDKDILKAFRLNVAVFEIGKADLSPEAKEVIQNVAKNIKSQEYNKISVEGHTDITGTVQGNKTLSTARAKAVYQELVNGGIPAEKIEYLGFAATKPIETNSTEKGRSANRRTEIYVK